MPRVVKRRLPYRNVGELLEKLGDIPPERVCLNPPPGRATKDDLVRLHSREDKLYELVEGTLVEKPMGFPESYLALELGFLLRTYLEANDLGFLCTPDVLIEFLPELVRGPDVCFIRWDTRLGQTVPADQIGRQIPDLAVEILSPSNSRREMLRKRKEYFLAGVRVIWEIDPATRTAEAYTAPDVKTGVGEAGTLAGGDVLPGFELPLAKLFARLAKPAAKKPRKKK
jgi:Uma2 family endonuclease